jgi:hypothetical protein
MEIKFTDRTQLKEYFKKNKIPKESDFAEFIDGVLNQRDDGIVKAPGDPLSIEAVGEAQNVQKLLNFYERLSDALPVWSLNMAVKKGNTVARGLDISSKDGVSRFFIDEATGKIGIGTLTPKAALHIAADVVLGVDEANKKFILHSRSSNGGDFLHIAPDKSDGSWNWSAGIVIQRNGNVGICTTPSERLHVTGNALVDGGSLTVKGNINTVGDLHFGAGVRQMLNLWNAEYGIGVQNYTLYHRSHRNFAWYTKGVHHNDELNAGGGTLCMVLADGKLGIGTSQPAGRVQVINTNEDANGGALILGPTAASNLRMGSNNEYSWIQSHGNKPLAINPVGNNVGIGITTPEKKLHVSGEIRVQASHNNATADIGTFYSNDLSQGIGIGHNKIEAIGKNQDVNIIPKGTGTVKISGDLLFGNNLVRTQTKPDAGLQGNAGARSGFYETDAPVNYYQGASGWQHLIDCRHSNPDNNFSLQIAGGFFDQELYFRKTNNNPATVWNKIIHINSNHARPIREQMVHRRPILGLAGHGPFAFDQHWRDIIHLYGPFGYGVPSVQSNAERKYRLYAIYTDNMTTQGEIEVQFNLENPALYPNFKLGRTWGGNAGSSRDAFSDWKSASEVNTSHGRAHIRATVPSQGTLYYLELQTWDFYK